MINNRYELSSVYHFPIENMDNDLYITERISSIDFRNSANRAAFERILRFLYITNYANKISRQTLRNYEHLLAHPAEKIMAYRLETRCSGSERRRYGINSVLAVKKARYQCQVCSLKDVRCLEIDHINGRRKPIGHFTHVYYEIDEFQCLCSNHHRIKTTIEKQQN